MHKNIIIEGEIKSGKSFVLNTILKGLNLNYGGFITFPYFENGLRIGFKIKDLITNDEGVIAIHNIDKNLIIYPEVFDDLGVRSLENGYKNSDLIIMDELGFLEDESYKFKSKVIEILKSDKKTFIVIKERKTPFLEEIIRYGKIFKINKENRENIIQEIILEAFYGYL
ncbi:MAG: nucleoside-triphosphatase [Caldisericia bacterium]|nr:nucleoside-triphosphatase [Caldisericia bacterium]